MRIVVIDDNSTFLKFISIMIKKECHITEDDELKTYLSLGSFYFDRDITLYDIDVISCDYDLGKDSISGLTFLVNVINSGFEGECILLTGFDTIALREELSLYPSINYVIKNAHGDKTISTVSQIGKVIKNAREKLKQCV